MGTRGRSQHNTLNLQSPSCGSPPDELAVRKRGVSLNLCLAEKARDSHASLLSFCSLLASCLEDHHLLLLTSLGQQAACHGPQHGGRAQQDTGSIQERKKYTGWCRGSVYCLKNILWSLHGLMPQAVTALYLLKYRLSHQQLPLAASSHKCPYFFAASSCSAWTYWNDITRSNFTFLLFFFFFFWEASRTAYQNGGRWTICLKHLLVLQVSLFDTFISINVTLALSEVDVIRDSHSK